MVMVKLMTLNKRLVGGNPSLKIMAIERTSNKELGLILRPHLGAAQLAFRTMTIIPAPPPPWLPWFPRDSFDASIPENIL